jgi:tetratricopeptide (TPR) repeat protein
LRPAYEASDRHALMQRVMNDEPERLRRLVPHLPRDLETIVVKATVRDPAARYASAAALAEDLQRFLDDKPIRARRVTASEQAWRWARRNPAVATLAAGLLLALVGGLIGVTWQWRRAAANLKLAEAANVKAQARFGLAMEAVRAFTTGASEDVILKEKSLGHLRRKLLGQSRVFYERLKGSLEGETDRASRSALAEALVDAGTLYAKVDAPTKAEQTYREALSLWESLLRERPGDAVTRRDLGRTRLALAELLASPTLQRYTEARAELARARDVLDPLARERPGDGGARRLLAECESLDGNALVGLGRTEEGRAALERARAVLEALLRDSPPYTLPTTADGPTEYRRGLADVIGRIALSWARDGDEDRAAAAWEEQWRVLEVLTAGPFADDGDWLKLAHGYHMSIIDYGFREEDIEPKVRRAERASEILQRLVDASPTVAAYRRELAGALLTLGRTFSNTGRFEKARWYMSRSLDLLRTIPAVQRGAEEALCELVCLRMLSRGELETGRPSEALRHINRAIAVWDESTRAFPDCSQIQKQRNSLLLQRALVEATAGRPGDALATSSLAVEHAEAYLHDHPRARVIQRDLARTLLLESFLLLQAGRLPQAARASDRAATAIEGLPPPLSATERFFRGAAHACFFAMGRPEGPGRPAEPPGLRTHSDQAVADVLEADRRGCRLPVASAMVASLLPDRPELRLLLLDQAFPDDPFMPDPTADAGDPVP